MPIATRRSIYFTQPYTVKVVEEPVPSLEVSEMLVRTHASAISAGTEMLFYRGAVPQNMALDSTIHALDGPVRYPLKYGYAAVGSVVAVGADVDASWIGRRVFAFVPHQSYFTAAPDSVVALPDTLDWHAATLLPNLETAVTLAMDGRPIVGEHVVVFGQGIVGLLTVALLSRFPLCRLTTVEPLAVRRQQSLRLGAHHSLEPGATGELAGADLVYELSGDPAALDAAIRVAGFAGRIVIGSWYGQKRATLDLGGEFHRSRIHLVASQVSTIGPEYSGRWTKRRRLDTALAILHTIDVDPLITHTLPVERAPEAYRLLDQCPEQSIQVVLTYDA